MIVLCSDTFLDYARSLPLENGHMGPQSMNLNLNYPLPEKWHVSHRNIGMGCHEQGFTVTEPTEKAIEMSIVSEHHPEHVSPAAAQL